MNLSLLTLTMLLAPVLCVQSIADSVAGIRQRGEPAFAERVLLQSAWAGSVVDVKTEADHLKANAVFLADLA